MTLPAYLQILSDLRARLARGDWQVGDRMPTDEALTQEYGVSRFTVRAAIDVLVADGIVARFRSRGSFVKARAHGAGTWMLTSLDDMVVNGFPTRPIILDAETVPHSADVASALGVEEGRMSLRIRVLRQSDGLPYSYSIIHVPQPLAAQLPADWRSRAASEPFVGIVAEANAMAIGQAIQVAHAVAAPADVAERLEVSPGTPLLLLERTFFAREGAALEHAQIFSRSDRYRQILSLRSGRAPDNTDQERTR